MKKQIKFLPLLLVAFAMLMLNACKKVDDTDDSVSATDQNNVTSALNAATDDATNAIGGVQSLSGKTDGLPSICGGTVDNSQDSIGILTINYNGTGPGCLGITRTGSITITLQNYPAVHWKDIGAVLQIDFNNLKVTNTVTGAYYTLNGTHTLTNVTGGLAWKIMDGSATGTVTHRHLATNFTLTFADGSQRTWSVNRLRTFTNSGGVRTVTLSSDHTENGVSNVDMWGTNRNGAAFINAIVTAITSNSTCGFYKPVVGEYSHHVANRSVDVLLGIDILTGNPPTSGCATGYKITYIKRGRTATLIGSYWF